MMKKILLAILTFVILTGCNTTKNVVNDDALKNLTANDTFQIFFKRTWNYYDEDGIFHHSSRDFIDYEYPTKINENGEVSEQTIEFYEDINEYTKTKIAEFYNLKSYLNEVDDLNFDENKLNIYFKNLADGSMTYFYEDGKVKEIRSDGERIYYTVEDIDTINNLVHQFQNGYTEIELKYISPEFLS